METVQFIVLSWIIAHNYFLSSFEELCVVGIKVGMAVAISYIYVSWEPKLARLLPFAYMYCIYHIQATILFTYCSYMYLIIGDLDLFPSLLKLDGESLLGLLQGAVLLLEDLVFSLWGGKPAKAALSFVGASFVPCHRQTFAPFSSPTLSWEWTPSFSSFPTPGVTSPAAASASLSPSAIAVHDIYTHTRGQRLPLAFSTLVCIHCDMHQMYIHV